MLSPRFNGKLDTCSDHAFPDGVATADPVRRQWRGDSTAHDWHSDTAASAQRELAAIIITNALAHISCSPLVYVLCLLIFAVLLPADISSHRGRNRARHVGSGAAADIGGRHTVSCCEHAISSSEHVSSDAITGEFLPCRRID